MQATQTAADWIEMTILSNMIVNPDQCREALTVLKSDDFTTEEHRVIFLALQRMEQTSTMIRFFVLLEYLQKHNLMTRAGGNDYLKLLYLYIPECELEEFMQTLKRRACHSSMMPIAYQ